MLKCSLSPSHGLFQGFHSIEMLAVAATVLAMAAGLYMLRLYIRGGQCTSRWVSPPLILLQGSPLTVTLLKVTLHFSDFFTFKCVCVYLIMKANGYIDPLVIVKSLAIPAEPL